MHPAAHRLSMLFAILGLACAGLAATLIIRSANPPSSSTVISYYSFQDAEDSLEDGEDTIEFEEVTFETQQWLRGGRRLTEVINGDAVSTCLTCIQFLSV